MFGVNAAVTFYDTTGIVDSVPVVLNQPLISVREGSMVYSYPCDKALSIYAMGETVYDSYGSIAINGAGMSGGASSSQGGLFVRDLQKPYSVYLYVTPDMTDLSATETQQYTRNRVERRGDGQWEVVERDQVLDPRPGSERISATHDAVGTGYWVLTQYTDSVRLMIEFVAYHHTPTGIDPTPVRSRFPVVVPPHQAGMLKFSADGTKLAMTNVGETEVDVFGFDAATGVVMNRRVVTLNRPNSLGNMSLCYGLSFSMSGAFIYVSMRATEEYGSATRSYIFRFPTPLQTTNSAVTPEIVTYTPLHNTYPSALQLGPNGRIYFTNNRSLGEISEPDAALGTPVKVELNRLTFNAGKRALLGLPTCIESTFLRPTPVLVCDIPRGTVTAPGGCVGTCITIRHSITNAPDVWAWQFPGGIPATWSGSTPPPICYNVPGSYPVILNAENEAGATEMRDTAHIVVNPGVDAGPDLTVCMGGPVRLSARAGGGVEWRDLSTNTIVAGQQPIVRLDAPTTYLVTTWQPCFATDTLLVSISPDVEIVRGDTSVCRGGSAQSILYSGARIEWRQGAYPVTVIDDSTYGFSPGQTHVYEGLVRWPDACTQRLLFTAVVIEKRQISIRVAPAAGSVGDTVKVAVRVRATSLGGSVRVRMDSLDGIEWQAPWDSNQVVVLDSSEVNFMARVVAYVNGSKTRTITTNATVSDTCSTVTYEPGLFTVETCAIEFRQVRFTKPLNITAVGDVLVVDGAGQINVSVYDVLGRQIDYYTVQQSIELPLGTYRHFPIFVVASEGAQRIIHVVR